ncbi:MAG: PKD domain-containing protein [Methanomassiliicoccales archaeon]|nr:PKD domain-containing protein [Methanomassiliicoccales archaeon]
MSEVNPGLLGDGALFDTFSQTVVVRANPLKHIAADLNADTRVDLAIIYEGSNVLDIFLANETYAFSSAPSRTITFDWQPTGLASGDMDKDGKADLVVSLNYDSGENIIICYQKNNFSSVSPAAKYFYNSLKQKDVLVHDLNGDGWLDVVALYSMDDPGYQAGFAVYRSTTPNNYSQTIKSLPSEMYSPDLMTMGDFNGDGRQDLVIGDGTAKKVAGYRNDASTGASWTLIGPINDVIATSLLVEQIAGDNREELIMALAQNLPVTDTPIVRVLRYTNASSLFAEFVDEIPNQPDVTGMTVVLNNPDSTFDLARISDYRHNLTIFNTPSGSPIWRYSNSISSPTPNGPVSLLAQDMNRDGASDLVVICNSTANAGSFTIYYHSSAAISNANDNLVIDSISSALTTVGDFNGDLLEEMVFYDQATQKAYFYRTSSTPLGQLNAPGGVTALSSDDLNGDGKDELVWSNATSVVIWWGKTTFFSSVSSTSLTVTMPSRSLGFGDLNHDGRRDLVLGCTGGLEVYWNTGTATPFSASNRFVLPLADSEVSSVEIGNLTGDGDDLADIAIVNATSNRVEIYHQQPSSPVFLSTARTLLTIVPHIGGLVSEDFNGDGRLDLATHSSDTLYVFLQYAGGFSGAPEFPLKLVPGQGIDDLTIGNLDDLGSNELALISGNSTLMAYRFDVTSSSLVLVTMQTVGASSAVVMAGDMNGDQKDDLIAYSISSRTVSYYYQNNFPPIAMGQVEGTGFLEGEQVWFNANGSMDSLSDIDRLAYNWDFDDDGSTGTGVRTSHVFQQNGDYTVVLNVSDPWGGWDVTTISVSIGDRAPVANFTYSQDPAPVEGSPVQFIDLSTSPSDPIVSWEWNFGDGNWLNQTTDQAVFYSYAWNDTFTVTLTVHDSDGSTDLTVKVIVVQDSSPTAAFNASINSPLEGQEVSFIDGSSYTADAIIRWSWNLGDGTWVNATSNGTVHHTYACNGTFLVVLTVWDIDGSMDSVSKEMVVQDSAPVTEFLTSVESPEEGQDVSFIDGSSFVINPIVKWTWDLGDGTWLNETSNVTIHHIYVDNGTYYVTLTVTDVDGNVESVTRTLIVKDTTPSIVRLYTSDGLSTYQEWDEITFAVMATERWDGISKYQWDFQTPTFQADQETNLNSTYHRYNSSGSYKVTVRVWDGDSYAEAYIMVLITDPAPTADYSFTIDQATGNVSFSAALSSDTDNDQPILQYRWNFEGTWSSWSTSNSTYHTFSDGIYSVKLEVKDDHNSAVSKTRNVTVDLLPPVISLNEPVLKGTVGRTIIIRANVTDAVGVDSVILEYTINNVTRTVLMTPEGDGIYIGQIPAQNHTAEISYRIIAEDLAGHVSTTAILTISVEYEDSSLFVLTSAVLLIALLILLIYLFLSRPIVDEVFVMYHDGTLLAHQTRRLKPGMDDDILGGMLIALQNFVRDSFKDEISTVLSRMDFGERKLLVERKDDFFLAVMLSGKRAGSAPQRMLKVLDSIEDGYSEVLKEWDGNLEKVRGIREETKPMFQRANPLDRLRRKDGDSL